MNLGEMIAEIDENYPNSLSNDSKVRKISNLQKKLFRTVVKRTVTQTINMIADLAQYTLDFSPAKIREVLVEGKKYDYRQMEGDALSYFFYIEDNNLGIYPTPTETIADGIIIFRYQEPENLSSGNLNVIPDFDEDYHSVLIYGVCREMALTRINDSSNVAEYFYMLYTRELEQYEIANQDTEPAQIQEESRW